MRDLELKQDSIFTISFLNKIQYKKIIRRIGEDQGKVDLIQKRTLVAICRKWIQGERCSFSKFYCIRMWRWRSYWSVRKNKETLVLPTNLCFKKKRKKESIGLVASTPPRAIAFKHRECFPIGLLFLFILIFLSFFFGKCSRLGVIKTPPFL